MEWEKIAPCGMNCALCAVYQRVKKSCSGCRAESDAKPGHCRGCAIKHCALEHTADGLCGSCPSFPCDRLKRLDRRYQKQYSVSLVHNLQLIYAQGMNVFLQQEERIGTCERCGRRLCIHRENCPSCGKKKR